MAGSATWAETMATQTPLWLPSWAAFMALKDFIGLRHVAKAFHRLPPAATSCTHFWAVFIAMVASCPP
jgi:hypothetical protein